MFSRFFKKKETSLEIRGGVISESFLRAALNTRVRNPVLAMIVTEGGYKYLTSNGLQTYFEYRTKTEAGESTMFCASHNIKSVVDEYNSIIIGDS